MNNFALGGLTVDPLGTDFDAINAEKTARWAADDAAKQGVRSPATGYQGYSGAPKASPLPAIDNPFQQPPAVGETTFQQDSDARQSRISAYADRLKTMEATGRANSLMGSSSTITRGFAGGGKIDPDELMRQMSAKYGAPAAGPVQQQTTQQPVPQPQPIPQQRPEAQGLTPGIVGILKGRQQQIDKAAGYANGGKIRGPGTPTSDSIPATVQETGEPIKVSTGERILSHAHDAFLDAVAKGAGYPSLDAMLEDMTGQTVGPTLKAGKRAAADGMAPEDDPMFRAVPVEQPSQQFSPAQQAAASGLTTRHEHNVAGAIAAPPVLSGTVARSEPAGGALTNAAVAGGLTVRPIQGRSTDTAYRPEVNGITWNAAGFDPTKQTMAPGTGAIAINSGPNAGKNIAVGPQNYTAADGSATTDWSKTAQYAQGVEQAQRDRITLATMQRDRLERDAYSPEITDPQVVINARAQIAEQDAKAAKNSEAYGRMLDNQGKLVKLQGEGQMQGLQAQYLAETDPARREALAERIRGVSGKGAAPVPVNLQHVETDRGTMVFDPRSGRMTPAVAADGQPVSGGKALTEFQGKSTSYGMRAEAASKLIDQVGQGGKVQPSLIKRAAEAVPLIGEGLGMAANKFASPEQQQVEQLQRDFVNAVLRQESGAAISASEFDNARKQYFPQPGDSAEVIAQKQRNRERAIDGFRISAGPGAKNIGGAPAQAGQPAQQPQAAQTAAGPKVGTVDGKHVFLGGNPADPASWAEVR